MASASSSPSPSTRTSISTRTPTSNPYKTTLHLISLVSFSHSFKRLFGGGLNIIEWMEIQYGGQWQYLTILGLAASWLTMAFATVLDIFPSNRALKQIKSHLAVVSVPIEGLIAVLYWSILAIDPTLLVPPDSTIYFPLSLDISIHGLPALFLWFDFLFFSPPFSTSTPSGSVTVHPKLSALICTTFYGWWIEKCNRINGRFPYPLLDTMKLPYPLGLALGEETLVDSSAAGADDNLNLKGDWKARYLFYTVCGVFCWGLFGFANWIHKLVRGDTVGDEEDEGDGDKEKKRQ